MAEVVRFEKYSYAYPQSDRYVLDNISFTIRAGECHCLGGPTGSGKTSLALAAKGLLPLGNTRGRVIRPPAAQGGTDGLGIVLQNPETQLLTRSVGAEVAFGLENQCVAPDEMVDRVKTALRLVGLDKPLTTGPHALSMGEKYRLLLACQLAMAPRVLILDEPATQLDPAGLENLTAVIKQLKKDGIALLLCDNHPGELQSTIDYHWHLAADRSLRPGAFPGSRPQWRPRPADPHRFGDSRSCREEAARVTAMSVADTHEDSSWSDASFTINQGQRVVLYGPNGSGKTTLLRCLTGLIQPQQGSVCIFGDSPEPARLRGRVGCLFQNPERQLFETTVSGEVAFPLKRLGGDRRTIDRRVAETLALCGIEDLAEASPHLLSYGQKHLVALASVVAPRPRLLLLDDPFAGLDSSRSEQILELLTRLNDKGTSLFLTSHNPGSLGPWPDLALSIEGGSIVAH